MRACSGSKLSLHPALRGFQPSSLRGGFAGNSPLARGDGVNTPPSLEKAPSETISELATLQSENATPPPA